MRGRVGRGLFGLAGLAALALIGVQGVAAAPPTNDDFADAKVIAAMGGTLSASNVGATKQVGEPSHAGDSGGASLWFSWTPNFTGNVFVDTAGSSFDTLVGVYSGNSVDQLTLVGSDDDVGTSASSGRVCFHVSSGTTWHIAVDGFAGATGVVSLAWGAKTDSAPCPSLPPTIQSSSAPTVGDQLAVADGTFVDAGATIDRQWLRCAAEVCHSISGATSPTYTVTNDDVGSTLRVDVTNVGSAGNARNSAAPTPDAGLLPSLKENGRIFTTILGSIGADIYSRFADGSSPRVAISGPGEPFMAAASPDGRLIAFVSYTNNIVVATADGRLVVGTGYTGLNPKWSPDGSRILFTGGPFNGDTLETYNVYTGQHIVLRTFGSDMLADAAWSPDGRAIAVSYVVVASSPSWDVGVLAADGTGTITDLTPDSESESSVAWSPLGDKLTFSRGAVARGGGDADLWVMNADGSNQHKLVDGDANHTIWTSTWSPDGTKIAYGQSDSVIQESAVWVVDAGGGTPTRLPRLFPYDSEPTWAPAASYLLEVSKVGTGTGSVATTPAGASCGTGCTIFHDPTNVTLTPTPASGSTFTGWSGDCTGTGSCQVGMVGDRQVTANFTSVPTGGGGSGGGGGGGGGTSVPDLGVTVVPKLVALAPGDADELVVYVKNAGGAGSLQTHLKVQLPAGITLLGAPFYERGSGCTGTVAIDCFLDYIPNGETTRVILEVRATTAGDQAISATASADRDSNPADNTTTLTLHVGTTTVTTPFTPPPAPASGGKTLNGDDRANHLTGTAFADVLNGRGGADVLNGGKGNDILNGGAGADILIGGPGLDILRGSAGNDTVRAQDGQRDTIDCGTGRDIVYADRADRVAKNCERIHRR